MFYYCQTHFNNVFFDICKLFMIYSICVLIANYYHQHYSIITAVHIIQENLMHGDKQNNMYKISPKGQNYRYDPMPGNILSLYMLFCL